MGTGAPNRTALPSGLGPGAVGVCAVEDALRFAATGVGAGDALTSGEIARFGCGAVALGSAVIEVDELGGDDPCGFGAAVLVALALALAALPPAAPSVPFTPR